MPPPRRAPRTPAGWSATSTRGASSSSTAPSCRNCPTSPDLSPGLTIRSLAQALAAGDPLVAAHLGKVVPADGDGAVALNTALMGDGAVIHVATGATVARPLHLVFAATGERPASVFTRSLVVIEQGARAMLVESHDGADGAIRSTPRSNSWSATRPMSTTSRSPRGPSDLSTSRR